MVSLLGWNIPPFSIESVNHAASMRTEFLFGCHIVTVPSPLRVQFYNYSYDYRPNWTTWITVTITKGKISAQPHTTLCIQFLARENNDKNNRLPLGKQICFTIVWGCAEILPCFSTEILKNILKRSCPFEFFFKQFYSVLLSSCRLLGFLLLLGHSFDLSP